jgi:hypothetical protein
MPWELKFVSDDKMTQILTNWRFNRHLTYVSRLRAIITRQLVKRYRIYNINFQTFGGRKFNNLTVLRKVEPRSSVWLCKCDCSNVVPIDQTQIPKTMNCGACFKFKNIGHVINIKCHICKNWNTINTCSYWRCYKCDSVNLLKKSDRYGFYY